MNKEFIHFERLSFIFGKHRATGLGAESAADAVEELDDQISDSVKEIKAERTIEGSRRKRSRGGEALANSLIEAVHIFGSYFDKSSERLDRVVEKIGERRHIYEDQRNIPEELEKMGLSLNDRIEASMLIMEKQQNVHLFWGFKDDARYAFVQRLLANQGK